jgi:putative intracellular protease/amidase
VTQEAKPAPAARWLYHLTEAPPDPGRPYAPASLAREGFVHASFRDTVVESARLYFPKDARLEVLCIDPRRIDPRGLEIAQTPRGAMPHVHAAIPADAIVRVLPLATFVAEGDAAPDAVRGTRFAFVAFAGMTLLDLVGVYDPISRIASMGFDPRSEREIVAAHNGPVWADGGARLDVARVRPSLDAFDVVIVPGGLGTRVLSRDRELAAWLASFPTNRLMASVCTGALLLGAAGRLRGKRATTHASALHELAAHGATPVAERVVDEGQTITAGGVTCALDLGLYLVSRLVSADAAEKMRAQMEFR